MIIYNRTKYKELTFKSYQKEKRRLQIELLKLQEWVIQSEKRLAIVFEGRDAAGKGATIKRFIEKPYREFLINFKVVDDSLRPTLPAGTYEAVPYVIIESNDVPPDQLIEALSEGYSEFSENYFNYPLYRTGGKFTVTE